MRAPAPVLALALAACGAPSTGAPPAVDSTFVAALVEVHLADARAALDTTAADPAALADSLRSVALAAHGLDAATLEARLDALADDPALARATYDLVEGRLTRESFGGGTDDDE